MAKLGHCDGLAERWWGAPPEEPKAQIRAENSCRERGNPVGGTWGQGGTRKLPPEARGSRGSLPQPTQELGHVLQQVGSCHSCTQCLQGEKASVNPRT